MIVYFFQFCKIFFKFIPEVRIAKFLTLLLVVSFADIAFSGEEDAVKSEPRQNLAVENKSEEVNIQEISEVEEEEYIEDLIDIDSVEEIKELKTENVNIKPKFILNNKNTARAKQDSKNQQQKYITKNIAIKSGDGVSLKLLKKNLKTELQEVSTNKEEPLTKTEDSPKEADTNKEEGFEAVDAKKDAVISNDSNISENKKPKFVLNKAKQNIVLQVKKVATDAEASKSIQKKPNGQAKSLAKINKNLSGVDVAENESFDYLGDVLSDYVENETQQIAFAKEVIELDSKDTNQNASNQNTIADSLAVKSGDESKPLETLPPLEPSRELLLNNSSSALLSDNKSNLPEEIVVKDIIAKIEQDVKIIADARNNKVGSDSSNTKIEEGNIKDDSSFTANINASVNRKKVANNKFLNVVDGVLLQRFYNWYLFRGTFQEKKFCYLLSLPVAISETGQSDPYFLVVGTENGSEIATKTPYLISKDNLLELQIGNKRFYLDNIHKVLWSLDKNDDRLIVKQMQKYNEMDVVIKGSQQKKVVNYSLLGFHVALIEMQSRCL